MDLAERTLAGDRLALARLLTQIENDTPLGRAALDALFPHTGRAHLIGVTGSPGTGKSSLVNRLASAFRTPGDMPPKRVGILAIDPSSPFTGGALLGDRVRMRDLTGDAGIFIRSMASRGALGGLSRATSSAAQALDAAGYEVILIETVGAGQSEVDIARLAHTTIVVEAPGLGDDIQAIKAGILEIADILVVNKADRPGVENTERALRSMLELGQTTAAAPARAKHGPQLTGPQETPGEEQIWVPSVLRAVATQADGVPDLVAAIERHGQFLRATGEWQRRERARLQTELDALLRDTLVAQWHDSLPPGQYAATLEELRERRLSPFQAVAQLLAAAGERSP
ncbi:MAG TPA: methylmalonyl Co-A mutase-associated GTPase MeaB [Anaerolineaceae bacterium]|nr:methylmalonyl Co-A mutase-associated GTPase MeaB [Anaerolineaceae bacterium]